MNSDPIADFLTRIRNASSAGLASVEMPASKFKIELAKVLLAEGYIRSYEIRDAQGMPYKILRILLKYERTGEPVIHQIKRISKPGLRKYFKADQLPRILGGAGVAILTTNKGLLVDRVARKQHIGGELLCTVY